MEYVFSILIAGSIFHYCTIKLISIFFSVNSDFYSGWLNSSIEYLKLHEKRNNGSTLRLTSDTFLILRYNNLHSNNLKQELNAKKFP